MPNGQQNSADGKISDKYYWNPEESVVELQPNDIVIGRGRGAIMGFAHWHVQVEINYVFSGALTYEMCGREFHIRAGELALFWGGLPHRLSDCEPGTQLEAIHLPLTMFFRLRIPDDMREALMHGAVLISTEKNAEDRHAFSRWCTYLRSKDPARMQHAAEELLLRIERIAFGDYEMSEIATQGSSAPATPESKSNDKIRQILDYLTANFRDEIDAASIADCANIHPKYAMSVFKRSTGITLNEYLQLLRLSYSQALLMRKDGNILQIATESGFGSLSNFNRTFRRHTGLSPSEFRNHAHDSRQAKWAAGDARRPS